LPIKNFYQVFISFFNEKPAKLSFRQKTFFKH